MTKLHKFNGNKASGDSFSGFFGVCEGIDSRPVAFEHTIPIIGELDEPQKWQETIKTIRNAGPNDKITLYINSPGGYIATAAQILHAMDETQATIYAYVVGQCASAATMIFLAADYLQISDESDFMIHTSSYGEYGKNCDVVDAVVYQHKQTEKMLDKHYTDFLTPDELLLVKNGKQLYLDPEDVRDRIDKRFEIRKQKAVEEAKKCGCVDCIETLKAYGLSEQEVDDIKNSGLQEGINEETDAIPEEEELRTWKKDKLLDYILGRGEFGGVKEDPSEDEADF